MSTRMKLLLAAVVATLSLLSVGAVILAAGILPAIPDDWANAKAENIAVASTLPPLEIITFTAVAPERVVAPDARPYAVLNEATAKTAQGVWVNFLGHYDATRPAWPWLTDGTPVPLAPPASGPDVAFAILATVKYALPGGEVLLTTAQPSPDALKLKLILGDQAVTLPNGDTAWATLETPPTQNTNPATFFPNRLVFVQGGLLITLASPLPIADLQQLATEVTLK